MENERNNQNLSENRMRVWQKKNKKNSRMDSGLMEVKSKAKLKINKLVIVADDKIYETVNSRCMITEKAAFLKLTTY